MPWSATSFSVEVPEIYQLEVTNSCQLACPMCIRLDDRVKRPIGFLDVELVKTMAQRGDFDESYFVELQMYGEPLLHPNLYDIVQIIKSTGCKAGMSTNGLLLMKSGFIISELDYLTISVDSADPAKYKQSRNNDLAWLIDAIDSTLALNPRPVIDLQVINYWEGEDELPALVQLAKDRKWDVTCRAVPDCFASYQNRPHPDRFHEVCLNPFLSVSVQWDGDIVPCCFSAGKDIVYGNLTQTSLKDIWTNSQQRKVIIDNMRLNYNTLGMPCKLCFMRSPILFHLKMFMENIKGGKK